MIYADLALSGIDSQLLYLAELMSDSCMHRQPYDLDKIASLVYTVCGYV